MGAAARGGICPPTLLIGGRWPRPTPRARPQRWDKNSPIGRLRRGRGLAVSGAAALSNLMPCPRAEIPTNVDLNIVDSNGYFMRNDLPESFSFVGEGFGFDLVEHYIFYNPMDLGDTFPIQLGATVKVKNVGTDVNNPVGFL